MMTSIGQSLTKSPWRRAAVGIVGAVTVAGDLLLIYAQRIGALVDLPLAHVWVGELVDPRLILALLCLIVYLLLAHGDRRCLGLTLVPVQGWAYWCRITLVIGLLIGVLVGVLTALAWGVYRLLAADLPIYTTPPHRLADAFVGMCITAPLLEESIYRLAICVPVAVLLGPAAAIAISGLLFGLLHVLAGVPGADNLIAGFFLAWAFLKSGSIMVPLAWHSLGNLCVLVIQVGTWYWQVRAGA